MWRNRIDPVQMQEDALNKILKFARTLNPNIENFSDLDQMLQKHPEWDDVIANAYIDSGYLTIWEHDRASNPWRYDLAVMESITEKEMMVELRSACISTIREAYSGGMRYAINLAGYKEMQRRYPRKTYCLLINLYQIQVRNDHLWRATARSWLMKYYPDDVKKHMEHVEPHSELWFSLIDRVEPRLGQIARISITHGQSLNVCSSCGDSSVQDYQVENAHIMMPGVPSLRLCDDCVHIRRRFGERLEPII